MGRTRLSEPKALGLESCLTAPGMGLLLCKERGIQVTLSLQKSCDSALGTAEHPVITIKAKSAFSQKAFGERGLEVLGCQETKRSTHPCSPHPPTPGDTGQWCGKNAGVGFINWQRETDDPHYWWPVQSARWACHCN